MNKGKGKGFFKHIRAKEIKMTWVQLTGKLFEGIGDKVCKGQLGGYGKGLCRECQTNGMMGL